MPVPFSLQLCPAIRFGRDRSVEAAASIAALGQRVLLVHGASGRRAEWLVEGLRSTGVIVECFAGPREPDVPLVEAAVRQGRELQAEVVVGLGGGAVLDLAKAVAGLIPVTGPTLDYLEVVGRGLPLDGAPLPWVALPTTSGTGAEVTANAVLGVPEARRKVSLRDPRLLPRMAVVDPALTDHAPAAVTLASGLDAITQVIEPYISPFAHDFTDVLCRDAIPRGLRAIQDLMRNESPGARDEMAWVSLCGGLALANAKLGAVHGLAGPLGGLVAAPHGQIAGCLLPSILDANRAACAGGPAADRINEVDHWIAGAFGVSAGDATRALERWSRDHGLPGLGEMGLPRSRLPAVAEAASQSSSMRGNPVTLNQTALVEAMERAW